MSIASIQIGERDYSVDTTGQHEFTNQGGVQPATAAAPEIITALVTMSGAADYAVGGYSLTPAQLGFPTTCTSAVVTGPQGALGGGGPAWTNSPGQAYGAAYNASTQKLQFTHRRRARSSARASWRLAQWSAVCGRSSLGVTNAPGQSPEVTVTRQSSTS